jgi:hypothetical protein
MRRDHLLGWQLPAEPLGPAIKPLQEVPKDKFREFETMNGSLGTMPHGRMPPASGGASVGQTDDGALTSCPGMRARNAEGSPASSPPIAERPIEGVFKVGMRVKIKDSFPSDQVAGKAALLYGQPMPNKPEWFEVELDGEGKLGRWVEARYFELLSPIAERKGEWIEWGGGECPVGRGGAVCYRMRSCTGSQPDGTSVHHTAGDLRWEHKGWGSDIVAYRVVE